jgi:hypothetical protein
VHQLRVKEVRTTLVTKAISLMELGEALVKEPVGCHQAVCEYRGWTTLEPWADKTVWKWQQVGLVPGKDAVGVLLHGKQPISFGVMYVTMY